MFFFDGELGIQPAPPGKNSKPKSAEYPEWRRRATDTRTFLVENRSLKAQAMLVAAGFTNVLEQRAGWDGARGSFGEVIEEGWKRAGLPSE